MPIDDAVTRLITPILTRGYYFIVCVLRYMYLVNCDLGLITLLQATRHIENECPSLRARAPVDTCPFLGEHL